VESESRVLVLPPLQTQILQTPCLLLWLPSPPPLSPLVTPPLVFPHLSF
jgi:hypothetical protein